jgi:hypothetical protein
MTTPITERARMPASCPACRKVLYATPSLRPEPRMGRTAIAILILGGVVSAGIYLVLVIILREYFATRTPVPGTQLEIIHYPRIRVIAFPTLPVALVPGLILGWIAYRRPKSRRLRCRNCGWSQDYPVEAVWEAATAQPVVVARPDAQFPIVEEESDPWKECVTWAWGEIRQGRTPEETKRR